MVEITLQRALSWNEEFGHEGNRVALESQGSPSGQEQDGNAKHG
jgi:hypothetical protein